jgi:microcystin-dependent protein
MTQTKIRKEQIADSNPTGVVLSYAGSAAPSGYLLCDGAAVSRATYADLFGVIGVQYGAGDEATTFNLPNMKGKVPIGKNSTDTDFDTLGKSGGAKSRSYSISIPSHSHSFTTQNHQHELPWGWDPSYIRYRMTDDGWGNPYFGSRVYYANRVKSFAQSTGAGTYQAIRTAMTSIEGGASGNTGYDGDESLSVNVDVVQPYQVLNYIIKI